MRTLTRTENVDYETGLREFLEKTLQNNMPQLVAFAVRNQTVLKLVRHVRRHATGSIQTCREYVYAAHRYSQWLGSEPDKILEDCWDSEGTPLPKMLVRHADLIDDYVGSLQDSGVAPGTVALYAKSVKALYVANRLQLNLPRYSKTVLYPNRSPTPEELDKLLAVADLREKVIICLSALAGLRLGTLSLLTYGDVREDLEKNNIPVTLRIKARQTKGQYTPEYWTYFRAEAHEYLRLYLAERQRGTEKLPPEALTDQSPLVRDKRTREIKPVNTQALWRIINNLYKRAGLIKTEQHAKRTGKTPRGPQKRYDLRPHSLRYFFRTQLSAAGVNSEYCEFMLGHKTALYNDVRSKGPEFLRAIYERSNLGIRQRTQLSVLDQVKTMVRGFGLDPEKVLVKEAISDVHRIVVSPEEDKRSELTVLTATLKRAVLRELRSDDQDYINTGQPFPKV